MGALKKLNGVEAELHFIFPEVEVAKMSMMCVCLLVNIPFFYFSPLINAFPHLFLPRPSTCLDAALEIIDCTRGI